MSILQRGVSALVLLVVVGLAGACDLTPQGRGITFTLPDNINTSQAVGFWREAMDEVVYLCRVDEIQWWEVLTPDPPDDTWPERSVGTCAEVLDSLGPEDFP